MTVVLGEMDVTRAKPKPRPRGTHPSSRRRPPTVRRAARGHLCPGGRRPPGPEHVGRWGMEDDVWRGQTDGSVEGVCLPLPVLQWSERAEMT